MDITSVPGILVAIFQYVGILALVSMLIMTLWMVIDIVFLSEPDSDGQSPDGMC